MPGSRMRFRETVECEVINKDGNIKLPDGTVILSDENKSKKEKQNESR